MNWRALLASCHLPNPGNLLEPARVTELRIVLAPDGTRTVFLEAGTLTRAQQLALVNHVSATAQELAEQWGFRVKEKA